ncbi:MAG TPA: hypothetical protein VGK25_03635, partial [Ignavibacteria bacterium]
MSDKINNIINETEQILKNINRFQKNAVYIEKSAKEEAKELVKVTKTKEIVPLEETPKQLEKKAITEVDLFGNVTVKKEDWQFSENLDEMNKMICDCQKCRLGATRNKFV